MPLETYRVQFSGTPSVTVSPRGFVFSAAANKLAALSSIIWMRLHFDTDDRIVVFEAMSGRDKDGPDMLKLGLTRGKMDGNRRLTAKKIEHIPWIRAVSESPSREARKFELKRYDGPIEQDTTGRRHGLWYIQLMPSFEESILPSEIKFMDPSAKGIYRYRGGDDGDEIIYIGRGSIGNRFRDETRRKQWKVTRIEYSILRYDEDDQMASYWESWWLNNFRDNHNGRLPRYNLVGGQDVAK
ncbi:MAG: hypothetical protein F4Y37_10130 [Caldilineaceae bacterium SB0664_bin_22]|nr:hypothetical protein [Caldilineaceae bacterium SB0664_bin_22]